MKNNIALFCCIVFFMACSNENKAKLVEENKSEIKTIDSVYEQRFTFVNSQDTNKVTEGEKITYFKNGGIDKKGMMKNGKRDGLWKSFYEDGTPWSETTFKDGIKNGKTTTWYPNGKKRYEGFFTNDKESGKWIFYDENGLLIESTTH